FPDPIYNALTTNRAARTLACAGIRLGALPAHGQPPAMPQTPVGTHIPEPFDVHGYLPAQVAFDDVIPDFRAQRFHLGIREIPDFDIRFDIGTFTNCLGPL